MKSQIKTIIITGGAGEGIGGGITRVMAQNGWIPIIVDCDHVKGQEMVNELSVKGYKSFFYHGDLTQSQIPEKVIEFALDKTGKIDGLVNNAGKGLTKDLTEVNDKELMALINLDFIVIVKLCRAVIGELIKTQGGIINIGSVHTRGACVNYGLYAAVKMAVSAFSRGLAYDFGNRNVRSNCIHPGLVESPQNYALAAKISPNPQEWLDDFAKKHQCTPYAITPNDIGEYVSFLMSEKSKGITGQDLYIDSGTSAMMIERD